MKHRSIEIVILAVLALLSHAPLAHGSDATIAFSFDDGLDPRTEVRAAEFNAEILASLKAANVKAIFYVAGKTVDSPEGMALVRDWGKAGHEIANHSYSHANFNSPNVSLEEYITDVKRNQALLENMPGWTLRFRFPYLKEGAAKEKRDGMRRWLAENSYRSGAVGIDASDWYYSSRFVDWQRAHPENDPSLFKAAYLEHLWERAQYYDSLSRELLGRSAKLVLLLHTNAINAAFLTDVINMFRSKGWTITTPEDAYSDPVYATQPDVLPAGESLLWSLAKSRGIKSLRYPAEDSVYEKDTIDALMREITGTEPGNEGSRQ